METSQVGMEGQLKWVTLHGLETCHKVCLWRFTGTNDILRRAGFRDVQYIAMIVWEDTPKLVVDTEGGYAPWGLKKFGFSECCVLEKGWETALMQYDKIPPIGNIEVSREGEELVAKIETKWHF